jgi:hypothetical protein
MARPNQWPIRVLALLKAGNPEAAMAQIKVAPGVKDLEALQMAVQQAGLAGRWRNVDTCIADSLKALAAPRLHRSP